MDLPLVAAFFASQVNVIMVDKVMDYTFPPSVDQSPEEESFPRLLRDYGAQEVMSTRTDVQPLYNHGIHGEEQLIGLTDTGIDIYSCFFYDPEHEVRYQIGDADTLHRKISIYIPYSNDREDGVDAHGTHVAGTLVGESNQDDRYNVSKTTFLNSQGIAYKARLVFEDIGEGSGSSAKLQTPRRIVNLVDMVYSQGARIHSASWGAYASTYTSDTSSIDSFMLYFDQFMNSRSNHPDCLVVFAAGNDGEKGYSSECTMIYREGTVYSPASAKNVLSVGSVYNSPSYNDIRASFSCMGPTSDGRIKPDILAPGVNIDSAGSSGEQEETCRIAVKSGTSMSTPIVAATASLFSQYLQEGFYPTGEAVPENGFIPTAATLKAMVIHSGQSIRGEGNPLFPKTISTPLPDNHQGFGRMDVKRQKYWV